MLHRGLVVCFTVTAIIIKFISLLDSFVVLLWLAGQSGGNFLVCLENFLLFTATRLTESLRTQCSLKCLFTKSDTSEVFSY